MPAASFLVFCAERKPNFLSLLGYKSFFCVYAEKRDTLVTSHLQLESGSNKGIKTIDCLGDARVHTIPELFSLV